MHGWLTVSLLSAESSRLGLHFVGNFHRWSRVIAFGSSNVYTEVICFGWWRRGGERGEKERERAIRSFSHSFLDEFYWNFMNDRKKSVFQIRHDRKKIGNRNRIVTRMITWMWYAFKQIDYLYTRITVLTAWDNWRNCNENNAMRRVHNANWKLKLLYRCTYIVQKIFSFYLFSSLFLYIRIL